jgi:hypothetical protein
VKAPFGLILVIALLGCQPLANPIPPVSASKAIPKGQPIPLVLAMNLNAGEAKEGQEVALLVAEDVKVDGEILIPKGTPAKGEVSWSRSEGSLSGIMGQPARLEVKVKEVELPQESLEIGTDEKDPSKPYSFNRGNTGIPVAARSGIENLLKEDAARQVLEKLDKAFDGESVDLNSEEGKKALIEIARQSGLSDTQKLLDSGKGDIGQIQNVISRLQRGDVSGLAKGDLSLSLNSVLELANLVGGLGDRLSRTLKGRTIHASAGTRVQAFAAESKSLPVVSPVKP